MRRRDQLLGKIAAGAAMLPLPMLMAGCNSTGRTTTPYEREQAKEMLDDTDDQTDETED